MFFLNGERAAVPRDARATIRRLADDRRLEAPVRAHAAAWETLHAWYLQGFVALAGKGNR
jgi:hypothetical protein